VPLGTTTEIKFSPPKLIFGEPRVPQAISLKVSFYTRNITSFI